MTDLTQLDLTEDGFYPNDFDRANCTARNDGARIAASGNQALCIAGVQSRGREKLAANLARVYNCLDFGIQQKQFYYAQEDLASCRGGEAAAVREKSNEECTRTLFEISGWGGDPALKRENFFRLQCGERLLRDEQLRRAHGNFLGGGRAWPQDRDQSGFCG